MINLDRWYTERYKSLSDISISKEAIYLYHKGLEERSFMANEIEMSQSGGCVFLDVEMVDEETVIVGAGQVRCSLRRWSDMAKVLCQGTSYDIYIDASGLPVRVLAPFLKVSLELAKQDNRRVYVVYVEPDRYIVQRFSEGSRFYDLAEGFKGISPLPTYETIIPAKGPSAFIPMLGFEGARFAHVLSQLSSEDDQIIPLIGVSGFRPEYPFASYIGNRRPLDETESWTKVHFAMAGSVVDAWMELHRIKQEYERVCRWRIAPIGTKPHAVAALLFAIRHSGEVELVYDYPRREKPRTSGVGVVSVTCVSDLIEEAPYVS